MIHYDLEYSLNEGKGNIVFQKGSGDSVSAIYNRGTIHAKWDGNILKGTFIDTASKGEGLIEFTFGENSLDARWKGGTDPGPMRGKWSGILADVAMHQLEQNENNVFDSFQSGDKIKLRVVIKKFDFYANSSIELVAGDLDIVNTPYDGINWRSISEDVESYWWEQEEEFYEFLYENGVEYTAKEYSDWYEFELAVFNQNGEEVFQDVVRG